MIIGRKVSVVSVNRAGGSGVFWDPSGGFRGLSTLIKLLDSEDHVDWPKIDLNGAETITVQDYKWKKKLIWKQEQIYRVKTKNQAVKYESKI